MFTFIEESFVLPVLDNNSDLVEKRRGQITGAATKLFAQKGFHETTIKDIAVLAGISPRVIYHYVEDKNDLLYLAIMDVIEEKKRVVPAAIASSDDPLSRFLAVFRAYVLVNDSHQKAVILSYRFVNLLPRRYLKSLMDLEVETNKVIAEVIEDCIKAGVFRPIDADLAAHHLVMMAQSWATKQWRIKALATVEAFIANCIDVSLQAMLSPKGKRAYRDLLAARQAAVVAPRKARKLRA